MTKNNVLDGKILIIDDEPGNVRIFERVLKGAGFNNVTSITDPLKAVETYKNLHPDLILLDLKMPELDGFGVMNALNEVEMESYLPILVMTAQRDDAAKLRALNSGAKDFIAKPFEMTEALTRVRNMLEVRLLHNEVRENNIELEYKVRKRTRELEDSRTDLIHRLVRASEYRDKSAGYHGIRVSHYASILAEELGMTHEQCHLMSLASPLLNVGKIGLPDAILLKEKPKNAMEKKAVEMSPLIGAEILSGSDSELLQLAESICKTHKEKWDGSGYPHGLKGEMIPLEGRIVAVCDHFDRMINPKPQNESQDSIEEAFERMIQSQSQKEPLDAIDEVMEKIERKSGVAFDPKVVAAFKRVLPEIRAAAEQFRAEDPANIVYQSSSESH